MAAMQRYCVSSGDSMNPGQVRRVVIYLVIPNSSAIYMRNYAIFR